MRLCRPMFTVPPAYQSFGRSRISRSSAITPSIRIGPTFWELMKIANSVAAAIKTAAGSLSGELPLGRWGPGVGVTSSGIEVVDQPEPLEHQPLIHQLDDRRLSSDKHRETPGRDHPGIFAKLPLDPGHHALDLGGEAEDDAGLHALGGGPADHVGGRLEFDALQA